MVVEEPVEQREQVGQVEPDTDGQTSDIAAYWAIAAFRVQILVVSALVMALSVVLALALLLV